MSNLAKIKNYFITIFTFLTLLSCNIRENIKISGISNLVEKQNKFIINQSNKNDVSRELGESLIKSYPDENVWVYIETILKKSFYGKDKLLKNDVLIMSFDSKGILFKKNIYNLNNVNKINFDEEITSTYALNESTTKKILNSMRKRLIARDKSLAKDE